MMTAQRDERGGWFVRWRERRSVEREEARRIKRQQAREREYLELRRARARGGDALATTSDRLHLSGYNSSFYVPTLDSGSGGSDSSSNDCGFWGGAFGGDWGGGGF